jgi:hypothetical protein
MGRLVVNNAMTVNAAFEAPSPDAWLVSSTTFPSGVVRLEYRPAPDQRDGASG